MSLTVRPSSAPRHVQRTLLIAAATLFIALTSACQFLAGPDELNPIPDHGSAASPIPASELWQEFQGESSAKYANDKYKNSWVWIRVDGVRTEGNKPAGIDVVTPRSLILRTPGSLKEMEFIFRFADDTKDAKYERGENRNVILCQAAGTDLFGSKLTFNHCRDVTQVEDKSKTNPKK